MDTEDIILSEISQSKKHYIIIVKRGIYNSQNPRNREQNCGSHSTYKGKRKKERGSCYSAGMKCSYVR